MFRRRRKQKTDYLQRLAALKSGMPRLVVRRSLNGTRVQFVVSELAMDKTIAEATSNTLRKYGWKGHLGNLPAAYLTGYLAGLKALRNGVKDANVDIGLQISVPASSLYAAAAGARDAGLVVPVGKSVLPDIARIRGEHIAAYGQKLKGSEKYKKQFSAYIKAGIEPEQLPGHFDEVKERIAAEFGAAVKKTVEAVK